MSGWPVSPSGATDACEQIRPSAAPSGLVSPSGCLYQGLAPLATYLCPFGAGRPPVRRKHRSNGQREASYAHLASSLFTCVSVAQRVFSYPGSSWRPSRPEPVEGGALAVSIALSNQPATAGLPTVDFQQSARTPAQTSDRVRSVLRPHSCHSCISWLTTPSPYPRVWRRRPA